MDSIGECFDNALAESCFATLECALVDRARWTIQAKACLAVWD